MRRLDRVARPATWSRSAAARARATALAAIFLPLRIFDQVKRATPKNEIRHNSPYVHHLFTVSFNPSITLMSTCFVHSKAFLEVV